ncbi:MAG: CRTAC1 family protein [Myxococcota bacterium]|nr:CRTAC1 family protein [Myxococcota bacterium]
MRWLFLLFVALGCGCKGNPEPAVCDSRSTVRPDTDFFTDISEASGIQLDNFETDPPEGMRINDHSRLAFADLDGDGLDDVVMHSLYPNAQNGVPMEHLVFLNRGDGRFADHSDASGLRDVQAGFFAFADVDDDGDQDLFAGLDLADYGDHRSGIWLNDGNAVFSQVEQSGVESETTLAASAVFADFDNDGDVDLFVGNGGTAAGYPDQLYRGSGDGHFTPVTGGLGGRNRQPTNGLTTCDVDEDGDVDVLAAHYGVSLDLGHDALWRNDGGTFSEIGLEAGFAASSRGNPWVAETGYGLDDQPDSLPATWTGANSFGLDCADVDGDGHMDAFVTSISHPSSADFARMWSDPTRLLLGDGAGGFTDVSREVGIVFNEGDIDGAIVDFDNDGRADLSVSRDTKYEAAYAEPDQHAWFGLLRQTESGEFESMGVVSGINDLDDTDTERMKGAQNHAWSDIDADGDLDLLVGGRDQGGGRPNFLFRNDIGDQNRWLSFSVEGDGEVVHRDAFGTRITITAGDRIWVKEKHSSRGTYNSEDTRWMHFGLGDAACADSITVEWPDGTEVALDPAAVGEEHRVRLQYPDFLDG